MKKNDVVFISEQGVKRGFFYQGFLYKLAHELPWGWGAEEHYFTTWYERAKKWVFPLLINLDVVKAYKECERKYNTPNDHERLPDGLMVRIFRNPFTTTRTFRKMKAIFPQNHPIDFIESFGYEDNWEECSGHCVKEITKIHFKNGRTDKIVKYKSYHYIYEHIIQEEFCNGMTSKEEEAIQNLIHVVEDFLSTCPKDCEAPFHVQSCLNAAKEIFHDNYYKKGN
jgi:predicted house-cleaning noncanonical NTP pyrophosphatase (MazG superfamily)